MAEPQTVFRFGRAGKPALKKETHNFLHTRLIPLSILEQNSVFGCEEIEPTALYSVFPIPIIAVRNLFLTGEVQDDAKEDQRLFTDEAVVEGDTVIPFGVLQNHYAEPDLEVSPPTRNHASFKPKSIGRAHGHRRQNYCSRCRRA